MNFDTFGVPYALHSGIVLNIRGLRKDPGKFFIGVLEKSWIFFVSKRVGTLC